MSSLSRRLFLSLLFLSCSKGKGKRKEKEETIDGWIPGPTVLKENECGPRVSYPSSLSFSSFSFKRKERKRGRETWRFRKKKQRTLTACLHFPSLPRSPKAGSREPLGGNKKRPMDNQADGCCGCPGLLLPYRWRVCSHQQGWNTRQVRTRQLIIY